MMIGKTLDQYMNIQQPLSSQPNESIQLRNHSNPRILKPYYYNQESQINIQIPKSPSQLLVNIENQNIPVISALSWSIFDVKTGCQLWGKQYSEIREMASLTKIMTFYSTLDVCEKLGISFENVVLVFRQAIYLGGTTAYLREHDCITLKDLFYALMLPSGNDAAMTIANYIGNIIKLNNSQLKLMKQVQVPITSISLENQTFSQENIKKFVGYMNKLAFTLGLRQTQFSNPHGLSDKSNRSNVYDLGKLASMLIKQFNIARFVVSQKKYQSRVQSYKNFKFRNILWQNTNILLDKEGFLGLKTGLTPNAGACLSALYIKDNLEIIVTILFSSSAEKRFIEAEKLALWAENQINQVSKVNQNYNSRNFLKSRELQISSAKSKRISSLFKRITNLQQTQSD